MTQEGYLDLNRTCLRTTSLGRVCIILFLSIFSGVCDAQQFKENPKDHRPNGEQPEVYWHDTDIHFDLDVSTKPWDVSVLVKRKSADTVHISLPSFAIAQVDLIHRAAPNRAVLLADATAGAKYVAVIAADPARMIDSFFSAASISLSPDNHYVLFVRFYPAHGAVNYDDQYRLYDVLATRSSNWPEHPTQEALTLEPFRLVGVPVYPLKVGEIERDNTNVEEGTEHQSLSDFVWSSDSKRIAFLDAQHGIARIVVVSVPTSKHPHPETVVYKLEGDQDPCFGFCGQTYNDMHLKWSDDEDTVKSDLLAHPLYNPEFEIHLNIPLSQFVPAER